MIWIHAILIFLQVNFIVLLIFARMSHVKAYDAYLNFLAEEHSQKAKEFRAIQNGHIRLVEHLVDMQDP